MSRLLSRRGLLGVAAGGLAFATLGVRRAAAATDEEFAYASFGLAAAYLGADYYARAVKGDVLAGAAGALRSGRSASLAHARALRDLLAGAGDTPAAVEDFAFAWPRNAFASEARTRNTGLEVRALSSRRWISRRRPRRSSPTSIRRSDVRRRLAPFVLALAVTLVLATASAARPAAPPPLTIFAAASLTGVFKALDPAQSYSFGGSNALETQLRNGAPADLFASASPVDTQRLFEAGIVEKPVAFTANRLALIVPKSNPAGIRSIYDLRSKPVKLVVASAAVPVGGYTLTVLRRMGLSGVLDKVVSRESDVKAVAGKVALGQADAGFVYVTDARPVRDQVTVVRIPAWAQPRVRYEIAVVSRSPNKAAARAWVKLVLSAKGQAALRKAGFLPVPKPST